MTNKILDEIHRLEASDDERDYATAQQMLVAEFPELVELKALRRRERQNLQTATFAIRFGAGVSEERREAVYKAFRDHTVSFLRRRAEITGEDAEALIEAYNARQDRFNARWTKAFEKSRDYVTVNAAEVFGVWKDPS